MYAGGFKPGNLSQLLPEASPSRIQNMGNQPHIRGKKNTQREECENTSIFLKKYLGIVQVRFHNTTPAATTEVHGTEASCINPSRCL